MNHIGFDKKFSLLVQEAHLTKNTLLSGIELLFLKANFFQDKDGYFYSAFFHLSIGAERMLKLAVITHYMLTNNYQTPTIQQLKKDYGHDIKTLYNECQKLMPIYRNPQATQPTRTAIDDALIVFFTEYGAGSRYFNLNEVCEAKMNRSPLYKWLDIASSVYEEYTPYQVRDKSALNLLYRMDREGSPNVFTIHLTEQGYPMTVFELLHRQYVIEKSAPLVIWRIIETLQPIHFLLKGMADKATIKRRKKWLNIFNS